MRQGLRRSYKLWSSRATVCGRSTNLVIEKLSFGAIHSEITLLLRRSGVTAILMP